ncbi:MAG: hypothetical protein R3C03_01810 [Pirellulaceae bacterium]
MATKPEKNLITAWAEYIHEIKGKLDSTAFEQMKTSILKRAELVVCAAGFLGLATVSETEKKAMAFLRDSLA